MRFQVTLETGEKDGAIRLRRALRCLWRSHRLRCSRILEVPEAVALEWEEGSGFGPGPLAPGLKKGTPADLKSAGSRTQTLETTGSSEVRS